MTQRTKQYFRDLFVTGYVVKQQDFEDLIDSLRHITDKVDLADVSQIESLLSNYRAKAVKVPLEDVDGLSTHLATALNGYWKKDEQIPLANLPDFSSSVNSAIAAAISSGNILVDSNTLIDATFNYKQVLVNADVVIEIPADLPAGINVSFDVVQGCWVKATSGSGSIDGLNDPDNLDHYRVPANGVFVLSTYDNGSGGVIIRLNGDFI